MSRKTRYLVIGLMAFSLLVGCNETKTSSSNSSPSSLVDSTSSFTSSDVTNSTSSSPSSLTSSSTTISSSSKEVVSYRLTLDVEEGISYQPLEETYPEGQEVIFLINTPLATGETYDVRLNGVQQIEFALLSYRFNMPSQDSTLRVVKNSVETPKFDITFTNGSDYTITVDDDLTRVEAGTNIKFNVSLTNAKASLKEVLVQEVPTNEPVTVTKENDKYSFTMPESNVKIVVTTSYVSTISFDYNDPSHVSGEILNSKDSYASGEQIQFTLTVSEGFGLDNVRVVSNNEDVHHSVNSEGIYSFTMPADDVVIRVQITSRFKVSVQTDSYSKVTISNQKESYALSETVEFSVLTTSPNYMVDTVELILETPLGDDYDGTEGVLSQNGTKYTFKMPQSNVTIKVTSKINNASEDPFKEPCSYLGNWYYNGDHYVQIDFNGDGTLNWYISFTEDDWGYGDYGDYWAYRPAKKAYQFSKIPGATVWEQGTNVSYTFLKDKKQISFGYIQNRTLYINLTYGSDGSVVSMAFTADVRDESQGGYYKTKDVQMTKI